jgi:uncharacterized NAD(P)/FAD-binding protein YdhS
MQSPTFVPTVAIVGAGASGSTAAMHIARAWPRATPLRIVMYDARGKPGRGIAYGTDEHCHLLNVPAGRMSALADEPTHFLNWLQERQPDATAWTFAPRALYGEYLTETLREQCAQVELVVRGRAVSDVVRNAHGFQVRSAHEADHVDIVVVATGNLPPAPLVVAGVALEPTNAGYVADPWQPGALSYARERAGESGTVLLVGSGLTAVDVALSLSDANPNHIRIVCVSRHGLLPRRHVSPLAEPWPVAVPTNETLTVRELEDYIRHEVANARAEGTNWRAVIDGLRPHVSTLWRRLPVAERRRFLAGPSRLWDVHRHRMAPAVGAVVAELLHRGCLEVRAARLADVRPGADGFTVTLRGGDADESLPVSAIVNCTGPAVAGVHGGDQLLTRLVARGLAGYDALGLGVCTDDDGRLIDAHDVRQSDLFAIGPLRRGELWESTAVPEIRQQAAVIGQRVAEYAALSRGLRVMERVGVAD